MNRSLAASVVSLTFALGLLAACGDGGDEVSAEPEVAATPVEPGSCMPDQAGFDALKLGASREAVEAALGCAGVPDAASGNPGQTVFKWADPADARRTLRLVFTNNTLAQKDGRRLDPVRKPSTCVPSAALVNALPDTSTYADAVRALGCEGERIAETRVAGVAFITYQWGSGGGTAPVALVAFLNDRLIERRLVP